MPTNRCSARTGPRGNDNANEQAVLTPGYVGISYTTLWAQRVNDWMAGHGGQGVIDMLKTVALVSVVLLLPAVVHAEGLWGDIKQGVSSAADSVSDAAVSVTQQESPAETRKKIDNMAGSTLDLLLRERSGARELYDRSFGYAVFDTRKISFMITTGYGAGVAVEKAAGKRTYMKMLTGGVNVGMGGEFFQLVVLFENKERFDSFVNNGFEAGSEASAVAGSGAQGIGARFTQGMAFYELNEKGLKLTVDLTGTKYWKDDSLN